MIRALPLLLLAACADLPPVEGTISDAARADVEPELVPLDPLLAEGNRASRAAAAQGPLQDRGAALSQTGIVAPDEADLVERARRLRDRAAELRAAEI